jgi:protoheme IX farnesyltransferase
MILRFYSTGLKIRQIRPEKYVNFFKPSSNYIVEQWKKKPTLVDSLNAKEGSAFKNTFQTYANLSKAKLSGLVVASTAFGFFLAPSTGSLFLDAKLFGLTVAGTTMCVCSANSLNQLLEVTFDAQMKRTFNRVLPRHKVSLLHAAAFGVCSAALGGYILCAHVNSLTGILGLSNIVLYAFVYTPLKRISIVNTWVGAVVGSIPPVMGWVARNGPLDWSCLLVGAVLFAWQFPHFNSLSWNIRSQYAKAGYWMMSVINPRLNALTCLFYSLSLVPMTLMAGSLLCNLTDNWFCIDGNILNIIMSYHAYNFYKNSTHANARKLFLFTLVHLPFYMLLMILHKNRSGITDQ